MQLTFCSVVLEWAYHLRRWVMKNEADLIEAYLAKRNPAKCRPAFAQGCEIKTSERKLIRRDRKYS